MGFVKGRPSQRKNSSAMEIYVTGFRARQRRRLRDIFLNTPLSLDRAMQSISCLRSRTHAIGQNSLRPGGSPIKLHCSTFRGSAICLRLCLYAAHSADWKQ